MTPAPYPNRKLNLAHALTGAEDAYNPRAMANIALANLGPGEVILVNGRRQRVDAISEKAIVLTSEEGVMKRYGVFTQAFEALARDTGGTILGAFHGCESGDLMKALDRDPALCFDQTGMRCIVDTEQATQKALERLHV